MALYSGGQIGRPHDPQSSAVAVDTGVEVGVGVGVGVAVGVGVEEGVGSVVGVGVGVVIAGSVVVGGVVVPVGAQDVRSSTTTITKPGTNDRLFLFTYSTPFWRGLFYQPTTYCPPASGKQACLP